MLEEYDSQKWKWSGFAPPDKDRNYVYTHACPLGGVFYVGSGKNYRAQNFSGRSPAHKAMVHRLGRANVVIQIYYTEPFPPVSAVDSSWDLNEEDALILEHILAGDKLLQTPPVSVQRILDRKGFVFTPPTGVTAAAIPELRCAPSGGPGSLS